MLERRCNASFSNTPRARATTPPAPGGCHCFQTSLNEKITLCITRCTSPSCSIFQTLGASLSLYFTAVNSFLCFCLLLLSFRAPSCLWLARFSALSLNQWPFLSCFFSPSFFFSQGSCSARRFECRMWKNKILVQSFKRKEKVRIWLRSFTG